MATFRNILAILIAFLITTIATPSYAYNVRGTAVYKDGAKARYAPYVTTGIANLTGETDGSGRFNIITAGPGRLRITVRGYRGATGHASVKLTKRSPNAKTKVQLSKTLPKDKNPPVITGVLPVADADVETDPVPITVNVTAKSGIAKVTASCNGKDLGKPTLLGTSQYSWKPKLGSLTANMRYTLVITALSNRNLTASTSSPFDVIAPATATMTVVPDGRFWPLYPKASVSSGYPLTSVEVVQIDPTTSKPVTMALVPLDGKVTTWEGVIRTDKTPLNGGPLAIRVTDSKKREVISTPRPLRVTNQKSFSFAGRIQIGSPIADPTDGTVSNGLVYVGDAWNGGVVVVDPYSNKVVRTFSTTNPIARVTGPSFIAVNSKTNAVTVANLGQGGQYTVLGGAIRPTPQYGYRDLTSKPGLPVYAVINSGIAQLNDDGTVSRLFRYNLEEIQALEIDENTGMFWAAKSKSKSLVFTSLNNLGVKDVGILPLAYNPWKIAHVTGYNTIVVSESTYYDNTMPVHVCTTDGREYGVIRIREYIPDVAVVKGVVYEPRTKKLFVLFLSTNSDTNGIAVFNMDN